MVSFVASWLICGKHGCVAGFCARASHAGRSGGFRSAQSAELKPTPNAQRPTSNVQYQSICRRFNGRNGYDLALFTEASAAPDGAMVRPSALPAANGIACDFLYVR